MEWLALAFRVRLIVLRDDSFISKKSKPMRNYLFAYEDLPSVNQILSTENIVVLDTGAKQWVRIRLTDDLAMKLLSKGIPLHNAAFIVFEDMLWPQEVV